MNLPDDLLIRDAVEADVPHIVALILGGPAIANQHGGLDPNDPAQIETFRLIDADPRPEAIEAALSRLETIARQKGAALGFASAIPLSTPTGISSAMRQKAVGFKLGRWPDWSFVLASNKMGEAGLLLG